MILTRQTYHGVPVTRLATSNKQQTSCLRGRMRRNENLLDNTLIEYIEFRNRDRLQSALVFQFLMKYEMLCDY